MNIDQNTIKITIGVLMALLVGTFSFAYAVSEKTTNIQNLAETNANVLHDHETRLRSLQNSNSDLSQNIAVINAKLDNLNLIAVDIRQEVRDGQGR